MRHLVNKSGLNASSVGRRGARRSAEAMRSYTMKMDQSLMEVMASEARA
jgi:hypothetical protein